MVNKALFTSESDEWATPQEIFDELDREFDFNLDPCANETNAKCARYFSDADDGLTQKWGGLPSFLQSALFSNISMGRKSISGEHERGDSRRFTHTGADRYKIFSRFYIAPLRDTVHQGTPQVWKRKKLGAVPVDDSHISRTANVKRR